MEQPQQQTMAANSNTNDIRSLRVAGLLPAMDETYVFLCFVHTGEAVAATVLPYLRNVQTGLSERVGFVEFSSHSAAEAILDSHNGERMPNCNLRFSLEWDTAAEGTRWRFDNTYILGSFFGYDEIGQELSAGQATERYPAGATFPNADSDSDSDEAYLNNTKRDQTQWNGASGAGFMENRGGMEHTHMDIIENSNLDHGGYAGYLTHQQNQTQQNVGSGAGILDIPSNRKRPRMLFAQYPNPYHGGHAGDVNYHLPYQQSFVQPYPQLPYQHSFVPSYPQPPYQQSFVPSYPQPPYQQSFVPPYPQPPYQQSFVQSSPQPPGT